MLCVSSVGESPRQQRLPYGNKTGCGLPLLDISPPPYWEHVTLLHDISSLKVQSEHVCPESLESPGAWVRCEATSDPCHTPPLGAGSDRQ